MADNEVIFPVGSDRNNLKLKQINKNGTIAEMIQTIDENFRNIAQHGGGPSGMDGLNGQDGVDGTNVEYIYALSDEMEQDVHYPSDSYEKARLFDGAEVMKQATYKGVTWYDHPQPISEEHKNEYVFTRFRRDSDSTTWFYADKPELWAHWGETGKDGDGVEYIFILSKRELSEQEKNNAFITNLSPKQKAIYNIDDFYPGISWFNETNRAKAISALNESGLYESESSFESDWGSQFGLIKDLGTGTGTWSDDPSGTNPVWTFEYVSIRRSNPDEETAKKEWSEFSKPALWSSYNLPSRTFIIYCNYPVGDDPENPAKPDAPRVGQGWWDNLDGNDRLLLDKPDGNPVPDIWTDDNEEDPEDNEYTWMCSGIFKNSGENIYWSKPVRISGKDGKNGEDGTNIQFIYTLSNDEPNYPDPITERDEMVRLFDEAEELGESTFEDTTWRDRAMAISKLQHTEWMWERYKDDPNGDWEYADSPIIWAHWGEDGTDGDGVEYIFSVTMTKVKPNKPEDYETLTENQKKLFQIDDFVPGDVWFNKDKSKLRAQKVLGDAFSESDWENKYRFNELNSWNDEWSDNPQDIGIDAPYQWVSIRRTVVDNEETGEKIWGDFEDPILWNSYGKTTRVFIVYCNVDEGVTPQKPAGGFWNMNPADGEVEFALNSEAKNTEYYYSANGSTPNPDQNINVWKDSNVDVTGKIAWMSTGVFVDTLESGTSNNVSWSEPYRITGAEGKPGKDGDNIEFVYARCDIEAQLMYPKKGSKTDEEYYEDLNNFFDNVEQNSPYTYEDTTSGNETIWTDNPQGIEPEPGNRVEWMWSRQKKAGTTQWVYNMPKPQIWSRWGEDGTDGDGVEYIFFLSSDNEYSISAANWPSYWDLTNASDTKKAIYAMDDFYPDDSWFDTNKQAVIDQMTADGKTFVESEWTALKGDSSQDIQGVWNLGWTDNPRGVSIENRFVFVSIRKSKDGVWQPFSYPQLWTNYSITSFKSFVFTSASRDVDLSDLTVKGGSYVHPIPRANVVGNKNYVWSDAPTATGTDVVWMSSASVSEGMIEVDEGESEEGKNCIKWSKPQKMTDSSSFQVEWSDANISGTEVNILENSLEQYNFGNYQNESDPEQSWRNAVYQNLNITFSDSAAGACLMATCQLNNGVWSNWKVVRVKGEKGDAGTSISYTGNIKYELYLDEGVTYTDQTALAKLNAEKANLSPAPTNGDLLIVYPYVSNDDSEDDDIFEGDLYMWKYDGSINDWVEFNGTSIGEAYASPNRHLILWDSDSWNDAGKLVGPQGKPGQSYKMRVAYANGTPGNRVIVDTDDDIATATWMGTLVYPEDEAAIYDNLGANDTSNARTWQWSLFKGQDGYGYEYIYISSQTNNAPNVPQTTDNGYTTSDYVPTNWSDEPIEPTSTNKYVWMCWRKYDPTTQTWTEFKGKDGKAYGETGAVARLWQIYAESITGVTEYFHADSSISPDDPEFNSSTPWNESGYWYLNKSQAGWDSSNQYLFNVEVITYSDNSKQVMGAHLVGTWETGLSDIQDYYILGPANGTGRAPGLDVDGHPMTGGPGTEGKDYWTTNVNMTEISADYPYLWNISKKVYSGGKAAEWTSPTIIGVYGSGENGKNSIYIDLDNEMDSIQLDINKKTISQKDIAIIIHLYETGSNDPLNIDDNDGHTDGVVVSGGLANVSGVTHTIEYQTSGSDTWSSTYPDDGADAAKVTFSIPTGTVLDLSTKTTFIVRAQEGNGSIIRMASYMLIGVTNQVSYKIIPSVSSLIYDNDFTPGTITFTVQKQDGDKITNYTSPQSEFTLGYYNPGYSTRIIMSNNFSYSPGFSNPIGKYIKFTVETQINGTSVVMDSETIPVFGAGRNGTGIKYAYGRYKAEWQMSNIQCTVTTVTNVSNTLPTFIFSDSNNVSNQHNVDGTASPQGVDSTYTYEYRSECLTSGTSLTGSWSTPVLVARYLDVGDIQTTVDAAVGTATEDMSQTINKIANWIDPDDGTFVGNIPSDEEPGYISLTAKMDDMSGDISTAMTEYQTLSATTSELTNSVANAKFLTDDNGYLLVEKPFFTVWHSSLDNLNSDMRLNDKSLKDTYNVTWVLFKGGSIDKIIPYNVSNDYLYNVDKTKRGIFLNKYIHLNNNTNNLNTIYNSFFNNTTFTNKLKNNIKINVSDFSVSGLDSVDLQEYEINSSSTPSQPYITMIIWTIIDLDSQEKTSDESYYQNCVWNLGISELVGSKPTGDTGTYQFAYTKTASIFEEPLLYNNSSYVFSKLNKYQSDGYTIIENIDEYNNISQPQEDSVGGKLTVKSLTDGVSTYIVSPSDIEAEYENTNIENNFILDYVNAIGVDVFPQSYVDINNNTLNGEYYIINKYANKSSISDTISYQATLTGDTSKNIFVFDNELFNNYSINMDLPINSAHFYVGIDSKSSNNITITDKSSIGDGVKLITSNGANTITLKYYVLITSNTDTFGLTYNGATGGNELTVTMTLKPESSSDIIKSNDITYSNSTTTEPNTITGSSNLRVITVSDVNNINNILYKKMILTVQVSFTGTGNQYFLYNLIHQNRTLNSISLDNTDISPWNPCIDSSGNDFYNISNDIQLYINEPEIRLHYTNTKAISLNLNIVPSNYKMNLVVLSIISVSQSQLNLTLGNKIFDRYIIIPHIYENMLDNFKTYGNITNFSTIINGSGFLNNETFKTKGIYSWNTIKNNHIILDFKNGELYEKNPNKPGYVLTLILITPETSSMSSTGTTIILHSVNWNNQDNNVRVSLPYGDTFTFDKIFVDVRDKSGLTTLIKKRFPASNGNGGYAKKYSEVSDIDKPYLVPIVTEMASIQQSVSKGIACTEIMATVRDEETGELRTSAIFQQATKDETSIMLDADVIGIKSKYLNLDKNGLTLEGNVRANEFLTEKDYNDQIEIDNSLVSRNLHKKTLINDDIFEISSVGYIGTNNFNNRLYIKIWDTFDTTDYADYDLWGQGDVDGEYYGLPTLCMDYNGTTYILNPFTWINSNQAQTTYTMSLGQIDYKWYIYDNTSFPTGQTTDIYYNGSESITPVTTQTYLSKPNKLVNMNHENQYMYELMVDNVPTGSKEEILLNNYSLNDTLYTYSDQTLGTQYRNMSITNDNCIKVKRLFSFSGTKLSPNISYSGYITSDTTDLGTKVGTKLRSLMKTMITSRYNQTSYIPGSNGTNLDSFGIWRWWYNKTSAQNDSSTYFVKGLYNNLPYDDNGLNNNTYYIDNFVYKLSCYPICTIENGGKNLNNTSSIRVVVDANMYRVYQLNYQFNSNTYKLSYDQGISGYSGQISPTMINFNLNFEFIMTLQNNTQFDPETGSTNTNDNYIINEVNNFLNSRLQKSSGSLSAVQTYDQSSGRYKYANLEVAIYDSTSVYNSYYNPSTLKTINPIFVTQDWKVKNLY